MTEPALATRTKRVLTGYRPTGALHVGHWAGNVENMLALQADPAYECFFFIADWHMLTTHYDRTDELPGFIEGLVLDWLAAGLDPERAVIYRQSALPEVAEMALLFGMMTPLGWLERVDRRAVGDREQRHLGPVEELLDHHPIAGGRVGERLGPVVGDHDTLARREPIEHQPLDEGGQLVGAVVMGCEHVPVGDEEVAVVARIGLQGKHVLDVPRPVADVERTRRPVAGQHALRARREGGFGHDGRDDNAGPWPALDAVGASAAARTSRPRPPGTRRRPARRRCR